MNIALIGYGKMGKQIEEVAVSRKINIKQIFTEENNLRGIGITKQSLKDVDVCIDFSVPAAVLDNIESVADCGKNIVVGTTGWYDKIEDAKQIVKAKKIGLLYASNFSLGMNIFYQIVSSSAHLIDKFEYYDAAVSEIHHSGKADSPSGTALTIGQLLLHHLHRKKEVLHETPNAMVKPEQLHITSTRVGHVVGTHRVMFDSDADCIELVHTAKSRSGFALGALLAAEWLKGKRGIFTMKDVLS